MMTAAVVSSVFVVVVKEGMIHSRISVSVIRRSISLAIRIARVPKISL